MSTIHPVTPIAEKGDGLGEGPVLLERSGEFAWVDIVNALWHRMDLRTGTVTTKRFETALTGFAPCRGGGFIGAFADGIAPFDETGRGPWRHQPEADRPGNRFNDAGCDPEGRFIAGTMTMTGDSHTGAFYRYDTDGSLTVMRSGIGTANTVAFSPDGRRLYMADSSKRDLGAWHYDPSSGALGERDAEFTPPADLPGVPDGSAVDAEGFLWNARWGGGCVVRLAPDGRLDRVLELPVSRPTSCAFVGERLFITSASQDFGPADFAREPLAGSLFAAELGIKGVLRAPYAGDCSILR